MAFMLLTFLVFNRDICTLLHRVDCIFVYALQPQLFTYSTVVIATLNLTQLLMHIVNTFHRYLYLIIHPYDYVAALDGKQQIKRDLCTSRSYL